MDISRELIIERCWLRFDDDPAVYAFWLEGADSTGLVDQYSDLDLWFDVADDNLDEIYAAIEELLTEISPLDFNYETQSANPKIRHKIYHLQGSPEFLRLDVMLQYHSRARSGTEFYMDDPIESPLVIFDKVGLIRFVSADRAVLRRDLSARLYHLLHRFSTVGVRRYVARQEFLEAFDTYHNYVLGPLIELLRILHTPLHPGYDLVHISRHLPAAIVRALEELHRVTSLADILTKARQAEQLFKQTLTHVNNMLFDMKQELNGPI